jgi:hypothetical protein
MYDIKYAWRNAAKTFMEKPTWGENWATFVLNYTSYYNFMNQSNIIYTNDSYMGISILEDTAEPIVKNDNLPYYFNELEYQRIKTPMTSD